MLHALIRDLRHMEARAASDLADWLVRLEVENKSDRTIYGYHRYVAQLLRTFPDKTVGDFTSSDIDLILARTPQRSRHIVKSVINQFFEWALLMDRIDKTPMSKVAKVKHPHRIVNDVYSPGEVMKFQMLPIRDGALFCILFGTGIRRMEARNLRRSDIDLDRNLLVVRKGKGNKMRVIEVTPAVVSAVADLDLFEGLRREDYLWYCRPGGGKLISRKWRIGNSTFSSWYDRCVKEAGVRYLKPHTTRHTYHELMRKHGMTLEERALVMGHKDPSATAAMYGHMTMDDVSPKIRSFRLEDLIS